jgi:hypothetical protein
MELFKRLTARIRAAIALYMHYADASQPSNQIRYRGLNAGIAADDLRRRLPDA